MRDRWPNLLSLAGAIWLAASPYVLGYADIPEATRTALTAGLIVAAIAIGRLLGLLPPLASSLAMAVGYVLLILPATLGYYANQGAAQSSLSMGMLFLVMGVLDGYLLHDPMLRGQHHGVTFASAEPNDTREPGRNAPPSKDKD